MTFTPTDTANFNIVTTTTSVTVNKATPTISAAPIASAIIFGQTLASTALTGGTASAPGTFAFTTPATAPKAGTVSQGVTFTPEDADNYESATTSVNVTVNKALASIDINVADLTRVYNGNASTVTVTTVPADLAVSVTYAGEANQAPTAAGIYTVVATINDENYTGLDTGLLLIAKATATITLGDLVATFDGKAKAASASTMPQGLNVILTYDGSAVAPSAVGSYSIVGTIDDANYQGSVFGTLVIEEISRPPLADVLANLYGLSGVDAEALADPDSDGDPNLIEYAFGSSPVLPASLPEAARLVIGENATSFSAIVRDDSNLTVIPQFSMDLVTWGVAGITELNTAEVSQDGVPIGFTRRTWKVEGSMPRMYVRLQVEYDD